jgi:hypothetical protein
MKKKQILILNIKNSSHLKIFNSSISNTKVAFGGIFGGCPCSP